ncbi:MAG: DUF58 domain-containing protein [Elusimicrobia bacterium]|nr:DUF58 domain-containing protein [Elusimicrobiota bacterium]
MPETKKSLIDPVVLSKIGSLRLRAQTVVEGILSGLHKSPFFGHSLEFAEHRDYTSGDEIKLVDWKLYGKTDRFFVKQFEEETNLRLTILLDVSGSMGFKGTQSPLSKYESAATLCLSLAYLALKQGDSVGLVLLGPDFQAVPPRSSMSHWNVLVETLENLRPKGKTTLTQSLEKAGHSLKKRSLLVVISDLLEDGTQAIQALKQLRYQKHEVSLVHLLDREEMELPYSGLIRFESLENEESLIIETDTFRQEYVTSLQRWIQECRLSLTNSGIRYHAHTTNETTETILRSILKRN